MMQCALIASRAITIAVEEVDTDNVIFYKQAYVNRGAVIVHACCELYNVRMRMAT